MDALSRVLELADVKGTPDLRCLLAGPFELDHEQVPEGEAPYHLVLSGKGSLQISGGEEIALREGDLLLLPRGSAHVMRDADSATAHAGSMSIDNSGSLPVRSNTNGSAELDLLCGRFSYAHGSADLIMAALPDVLHVSLAEHGGMDVLRGVVGMLRAEVSEMAPGAPAVITALSRALFVLAIRAYTLRDDVPASLLLLLADARLGQAVQAMLRQPEAAWTVESLAERAAMSRASFARHFAAKGNTSPWELLTLLRMRMAAGLLSRGKSTVGDVAERVGYQSEAAFGKVFAKQTGMTPAAYRRSHAAGNAPR
ncbi:AraC family transcriptional regulator [Rhodanobacter sp. L36]|uniref:cupin domain-containing protein n=1 Tax=Rhodanobacter sp. L36 TaxID=1747221 RepID=UPI00131D6842|nr:AraC family transcriptional regulator [Rhodanobacter sp. L36]